MFDRRQQDELWAARTMCRAIVTKKPRNAQRGPGRSRFQTTVRTGSAIQARRQGPATSCKSKAKGLKWSWRESAFRFLCGAFCRSFPGRSASRDSRASNDQSTLGEELPETIEWPPPAKQSRSRRRILLFVLIAAAVIVFGSSTAVSNWVDL